MIYMHGIYRWNVCIMIYMHGIYTWIIYIYNIYIIYIYMGDRYIYLSPSFFIHPFVDGHWVCLHILAIVNNTAVNTEVQICFQINVFVFFGYIPMSGIVGPFGNSIFIFSGKLHIVFHSDCTNLHPHQQCARVPFYPHLVNICFLVCAFRW